MREAPNERFLVALNLGAEPYELSLNSLGSRGRVVLSTYLDREAETPVGSLGLRANEGVIVELVDAAS